MESTKYMYIVMGERITLSGEGTTGDTCLGDSCADCGGTLQWAEGGYTPYHRICSGCGSHWSANPVSFLSKVVFDDRPIDIPQSMRGWRVTWHRQPTQRRPPYSDEELLNEALLAAGEITQDPLTEIIEISTSWEERARFCM